MEYRRRRTRTQRYRRTRATGTAAYPVYLAAFFVFALVVYLISASRLGTWLADNVVAPVMLMMLPEDTPAATASPTPVVVQRAETEATVTLEPYTCYGLQIGVYASRENAEAQAESLKALGAAGYLLKDGERFRVLAAGYALESDAETVRQRLEDEGVDSRVHPVSGGRRTLTVSAGGDKTDTVRGAAEGMEALLEGLSEISIRFDRDTLRIDDGIVTLHALQSEAREWAAALEESETEETDAVADFYTSMEAEMEQTAAIEDRTAFSAALKRLYLIGAMAYCDYLNGV